MKKLIFCASAALVMLASCGKSEVCDCVDTATNMIKEAKAASADTNMVSKMAKMKSIQDKNKEAMDKCEKLNKADSKKFDDEAKKCDGYAEMEKLRKEGM
jgi:hypothetical protein